MRRADILARCIDDIRAGRMTLADCLEQYPDLGHELAPLLEIAAGIQLEDAAPSAEFKKRARNRLLEAMEKPAADARHGILSRPDWLRTYVPATGRRFALVGIMTLAVLVVAGSATVYASQGSLPDDALYGVKIGVENIQLAFTPGAEGKAALHIRLAQRRVDEVSAQSSLGRVISGSTLEGLVRHLEAAMSEIGTLPPEDTKDLLDGLSESTVNQLVALGKVFEAASQDAQQPIGLAIDAIHRSNLIARVAQGNPEVLDSQPSVYDEELEAAHFSLEGTLFSIENGTWNIGGVLINNVNAYQEPPPLGSYVKLTGLVRNGIAFIRIDEYEKSEGDQTSIMGTFEGVSPDGTVWYVSGIAVERPEGVEPPPVGQKMEIEGSALEEGFIAGGVESKEDDETEIEVRGVLVEVDPGEETITLEVAGTNIAIYVGQIEIAGEGGQTLTIADLEALLGKNFILKAIYRKDGPLSASEMRLEIGPETSGVPDKPEEEDDSAHRDEPDEEDEPDQPDEEDEVDEQDEPQEPEPPEDPEDPEDPPEGSQ